MVEEWYDPRQTAAWQRETHIFVCAQVEATLRRLSLTSPISFTSKGLGATSLHLLYRYVHGRVCLAEGLLVKS